MTNAEVRAWTRQHCTPPRPQFLGFVPIHASDKFAAGWVLYRPMSNGERMALTGSARITPAQRASRRHRRRVKRQAKRRLYANIRRFFRLKAPANTPAY